MLTIYVGVKTWTMRYPNVNLNSISLYKGVFIQPLEDKFFSLIKSLPDTPATVYKTPSAGSMALKQMLGITKFTSHPSSVDNSDSRFGELHFGKTWRIVLTIGLRIGAKTCYLQSLMITSMNRHYSVCL